MSDPRTTVLPAPAPKVTLTATELADLVAPVVPHAAADLTLPLLNAIRVTVRDGFVLAAATDRYRAAFKRLRPGTAPDAAFEALIPTPVLARIRSIFKATRALNPTIALSVEDDVLTVQSVDGLDGITVGARLAFTLRDKVSDYPKIDILLRQVLENPAADITSMQVNPTFLADFRIGQPKHLPIRITAATGRDGLPQWVIRCDEDFVGVLVPTRGGENRQPADTWLGMLDAPAEEKAVAA